MNVFKQISLTLRLIKLERFIGSLIYPWRRDRLERQFSQVQPLEIVEPSGNLKSAEATERGGNFRFEHLELEICFLSDRLVRVDWKPSVSPLPYGIARQEWETVEVSFKQLGDRYEVSTKALKILVADDGSLTYYDAEGRSQRVELPPQKHSQQFAQAQVSGWVHEAKLLAGERIYGLGERATTLNLRQANTTYRMWNRDAKGKYGRGTDPLYISIPLYYSLCENGNYAIFYENPYPADFSFEETAKAQFAGGALRFYFTTGSLPQLLESYSELTGRPCLPPRWALGYHHSRWGYQKEKALRETIEGFKTHDIPVSAMHLDIDCLDGFRAFTIDPDRFPHLPEIAQDLTKRGIRLVCIINPGIKARRGNKLYQEGREQDIFCKLPNGKPVIATAWSGECAFPDFTNPKARHWWGRQYEYLLDLGIVGFWHDMNEPAVFVLWGDPSLPPHLTQHYLEGRGGDHCEAHNVYGLLQAQAGYEALSAYQRSKRPFIISRAGWAGLQRYAWTWTGDVEVSWDAISLTIATVLNLGLSGIPYSGADIGGFKGDPGEELFLRWFQMSCFLPFCRTHSADNSKARVPWSFGDPTLSIIRDFLRLRYRLLPYFYTLAWEAHQKGYPLVRPLFWADSSPGVEGVEDAFLLGEAFLIAAIVEAGATSRSLFLPKGEWYDFWNDVIVEGAKQVELAAPLEKIPLLVKAGTIVPMEVEDCLVLHLYPTREGRGEGCLYSDAGEGYEDWRCDCFEMQLQGEDLVLSWQQQGSYDFPYRGVKLEFHGLAIARAWVDDKEIDLRDTCIEEPFEQIRLQASFPNNISP
jgi:alpha-glucosidase